MSASEFTCVSAPIGPGESTSCTLRSSLTISLKCLSLWNTFLCRRSQAYLLYAYRRPLLKVRIASSHLFTTTACAVVRSNKPVSVASNVLRVFPANDLAIRERHPADGSKAEGGVLHEAESRPTIEKVRSSMMCVQCGQADSGAWRVVEVEGIFTFWPCSPTTRHQNIRH